MIQNTLKSFVTKNEKSRNVGGDSTSTPQLTDAERQHRFQATSGLKILPQDLGRTRGQTFQTTSNVETQAASPKHPRALHTRASSQVVETHGFLDDTDVEAGDETLSSFTDPPPHHTHGYIQPEAFGRDSEYGVDEDDEYPNEDGQAHEGGLQGLGTNRGFTSLQGYDEADPQPAEDVERNNAVANVLQNYEQRISNKKRPGFGIGSRRETTPYVSQELTPRRRRNRFDKSHPGIAMPFRSGSAPAENESNQISPIEADFQSTKHPFVNVADSKPADTAHISSTQPATTEAFIRPNVSDHEQLHHTITAPAKVPTVKVTHASKASESTLDQTSGYTSSSSDVH